MAEDKKIVPKRKFNPDNIPPIGDENQPKNKNRFNIYWVYGLVFAGIFVYNMYRNVGTNGIETDQIKFTELVKQGDVQSIKTIRNKKIVRVIIKKDSLERKNYYKTLFGKQYELVTKTPGPQLFFPIVDEKTFALQMQDFL